MFQKKQSLTLFSLLVLFALVLSACGAPAATPVAEEEAPAVEEEASPAEEEEAPAGDPILEVIGNGQTASFTLEELQALPTTEGMAGMISSTGAITEPVPHKGVSLKDLVDQVGGMDESQGLYMEATDGYGITFSYDQVMEADFITYDPKNGVEIEVEGPLTSIVAYERDGELMDPVQDGQLRMVAVSPEGDNVIDGHWTVKWVAKLELKEVAAVWYLDLEGAVSEHMDRATFESGSTGHCHLAVWTDENGDEWSGIPLWYLLGRVDDEVRHEGRAFDEDLAEAGYTITITAADGYSVELASQDASFNDEWIVAFKVNGEPIADKNYPLRLVGEGLSKGEMVGAIASITLDLDKVPEPKAEEKEEAPAAEAAPAADVTGALVVVGTVATPAGYAKDEIAGLEQTTITAEHPKKGTSAEYTGVLLSTIFEIPQPAADSTTMTITASDGYSVEVPAADVFACEECLLADTEDGFMTIMPGFEGMTWVKDVVSISFAGGTVAAADDGRDMEGDLVISGKVDFVMPFKLAELRDLDVITINTMHPKKEEMVDYEGVRLNDLLDMAKPQADAETLTLTASDGYSIDVPLADVRACVDCLVAFDEDSVKTVMPGLESMNWVKDLVAIEVK